jgi:hypothetical protein
LLVHILLQQANQLRLYPANTISKQQTNQLSMYPANTVSQQPSEPSDEPNDDPDDDDGYLANPEPHNEYVGIDDEGLYLAGSKTYVGGKQWRKHI